MSLNARRVQSPLGKETILLAIEDVTVLKRSEQALRELSNRMMNIEDAQRRDIARNIHDVTGQKVAALRLNVRSFSKHLPGGEKNPTFIDTVELADQVTNEVRSLSYLLHPPMLDELGLVPALREYVEGVSERTGLQIELEISKGFPDLPDDIEITIFRVVQECLANVHRHSGSADAKIQLTQDRTDVELRVSDSGRGFPSEETHEASPTPKWKSGVGLTGMKERVSHLGGTFQISNNGHGTTVLARMPIPSGRS
jgi:two-component system, NarL family, sensor kinase